MKRLILPRWRSAPRPPARRRQPPAPRPPRSIMPARRAGSACPAARCLRAAAADRRPQPRRLWPGHAERRPPPTRRSTASTSTRPSRAIRASTATSMPATEEQAATVVQFARFASVCRTYAPLYRSATLSRDPARARRRGSSAPVSASPMATCVAAWHYYLDHYNHGRPFVLIGHSQGTIHAHPPDRRGDRERPGGGADAFGAADRLRGRGAGGPAGRRQLSDARRSAPARGQTGCVVTYISFRAERAAGRCRAARPRHPCRHDRRLHQPGRAGRRQRAARFLLVSRRPASSAGRRSPGRRPGRRRRRSSTRAASSPANAATTARPAIWRSPSTPIRTTPGPTSSPATSISGRSYCPAGASISATCPMRWAI